jgi:hypothetical protein
MALPLDQDQAIVRLAEVLYDFLPGKPHPFGDKRLSFPGIAAEMGLLNYWPQGGSKQPAITRLLSATLEGSPQQFCPLVIEIVRRGMARSREAVTREAIDQINEVLLSLHFKIPDFHDRAFLEALPRREPPATEQPAQGVDPGDVTALRTAMQELLAMADAQRRGFAFERFLNRLFTTFGLEPREPFRIVGEQIDGSFQFQGDTYLLEAKWQDERIPETDLLVLQGKLGGRAPWARGFFISWSGFTDEGLVAFARGKQANVLCMEGRELAQVLLQGIDFRRVVELKARRAAETNAAFVPVRELFPNVI